MRFSVVALAGSLMSAASVMAQVYPTAPIASTSWKSGQNVTVSWKWNPNPVATPLEITLFTGEISHQTEVKKLGTTAANAVSFKTQIPANLASSWYSMRIGTEWTAPFIIQGTGPVPTGPAPTAGTPATATVTPTSTVAKPSTTANTTTTTAPPKATNESGASMLTVAPMAVAAVAMMAVSMAL
ncbi:hypothetical protein BG004_003775 [Podila humilis]|nr:hypothetical protein BG004_003775 [Podila humilis]